MLMQRIDDNEHTEQQAHITHNVCGTSTTNSKNHITTTEILKKIKK